MVDGVCHRAHHRRRVPCCGSTPKRSWASALAGAIRRGDGGGVALRTSGCGLWPWRLPIVRIRCERAGTSSARRLVRLGVRVLCPTRRRRSRPRRERSQRPRTARDYPAWRDLDAAAELLHPNRDALSACRDAATKAKKEQRCSVVVPEPGVPRL